MRKEPVTEAALVEAIVAVQEFRAAHRVPLTKANMGLRSMVTSEGCRVEVTQRLKRLRTIFEKVGIRETTLPLWSMQDIAGCRAVLDSVDEVRRVQKRLMKNRPPVRVDDYVAAPKASGYRSVHVIVRYDERTIEVQLRTRVMHDWAVAVERLGGRLDVDLKGGIGPPEVLSLWGASSGAMAIEEAGGTDANALEGRIDRLRQDALPYLGGSR